MKYESPFAGVLDRIRWDQGMANSMMERITPDFSHVQHTLLAVDDMNSHVKRLTDMGAGASELARLGLHWEQEAAETRERCGMGSRVLEEREWPYRYFEGTRKLIKQPSEDVAEEPDPRELRVSGFGPDS
jgi:hypothetical protein